MPELGAPKVKSIESLRRGLEVLEAIRGSSGVTLHTLHRSTTLPKASLLRILKTLEEIGVVQRRIADGVYLPCASKPEMDSKRRAHLRLTELAAPFLKDLHTQLPWPSDIGVRDGTRMLVLESNRPLTGLSVNRRVVGFHPDMLLSALGRAYLAFCAQEERESLLRDVLRAQGLSASAAARKREQIERTIVVTRRQGYGVRDSTHLGPDADMADRFCAIAVPVLVPDGVAACLSCVWLERVATVEQIVDAYLGLLQSTASRIGKRLSPDRQ